MKKDELIKILKENKNLLGNLDRGPFSMTVSEDKKKYSITVVKENNYIILKGYRVFLNKYFIPVFKYSLLKSEINS
ncbi:hypothetical protein [Anaerosphaera multitolerans]|uniref:Uncharacterized protein n=1 Tax=Anaerosphaera multitolerans TaxID=2487351 RepID=A0A437S613_9FIRM|nr:hypothetical protein [Anaerosphaera multitolerans]RVU54346.1 hypothetical protein EF514_07825 [Anaerosphaera multitolerans]